MVETASQIYFGSRNNDFKNMLVSILKKGNLKQKYINLLLDDKSMLEYNKAFTAASADPVNNYEIFEQLGDLSINKFIVSYAYKKFPQLNCPQGVKVVARLRINYGSKAYLAPFGEKLGFWPYISAMEEGTEPNKKFRNRDKKALLEDCMESFIGCTEYLLDTRFRVGVGYGIVFDILSSIYDDTNISINYADLYDSKTRLKETFDTFKTLGNLIYINNKKMGNDGYVVVTSSVYRIPPNNQYKSARTIKNNDGINEFYPQQGWIQIGDGQAFTKPDAEKKSAEKAIENLKQQGIFKKPPEEYSFFCKY